MSQASENMYHGYSIRNKGANIYNDWEDGNLFSLHGKLSLWVVELVV